MRGGWDTKQHAAPFFRSPPCVSPSRSTLKSPVGMAHCGSLSGAYPWVPTPKPGELRGVVPNVLPTHVSLLSRGDPFATLIKGLRRQVESCLSYRSPLPESPSASFPVVLLIFFSAALNNHHGDWILALFCFVFGHPSLLEGILSSSVPHPQACAGREAGTIAFPRPFAQV